MTLLERLLQEAEELPPEDQERLAFELIKRVSDLSSPDLTPEWVAEIDRRLLEIDSGQANWVDWSDLRQQLWEGLDSRR